MTQRLHPPGGPSDVPAQSWAVGTTCDGVVHSNASTIQLHPIGNRFGLDGEGKRVRTDGEHRDKDCMHKQPALQYKVIL